MGSGQVFRPHFASPLHPWLGGDKSVVGGSSPSWHSPFTKPAHYAHAHSSTSPAPHSNSYSYTSSGLFASAFSKDEGMAGGAGGGAPVSDYSMAGGGGDGSDLKSAPMLSPLGACANKSGREGAGYSSTSGGSGGGGAGGGGEASATPLLPSYPPYPGTLGGGPEFPNPYYPPSSHFNKALAHDKPKSKPRSSAGKTRPILPGSAASLRASGGHGCRRPRPRCSPATSLDLARALSWLASRRPPMAPRLYGPRGASKSAF